MITIRVWCNNCNWRRIATTESTSVLSVDDIFRQSQTHANKENHTINIEGVIKPEEK